jgi:hypothetical protein
MTTHYKGQRIDELLNQINMLQTVLDDTRHTAKGEHIDRLVEAESTLAIMKAKLTALQGE